MEKELKIIYWVQFNPGWAESHSKKTDRFISLYSDIDAMEAEVLLEQLRIKKTKVRPYPYSMYPSDKDILDNIRSKKLSAIFRWSVRAMDKYTDLLEQYFILIAKLKDIYHSVKFNGDEYNKLDMRTKAALQAMKDGCDVEKYLTKIPIEDVQVMIIRHNTG